jgi:hypothetical protein
MTAWLRKLVLSVHVCSSVGWFGAVAGFLALSWVGLASVDTERVRAVSISMEILAVWIILPACLASLVSGVVQSLGTPWGLLRYHWTLAKLAITALSTVLLLVHMRPIHFLAGMAASGLPGVADLRDVRSQLTVAATLAEVALVGATLLSVYKPKGLTWYGRRTQPG